MLPIIKQKNELRTKILELRDNLALSVKLDYDHWICEQLKVIVERNKFEKIHTYLPMRSEINIFPFIQYLLDNDLEVYCPKTLKDRKMVHLRLTDINHLEEGMFGTQQPSSKIPYSGEFDLIIVPGLAYDEEGYRLGYGGGYYDKFLNSQLNASKIGVAYPFQVLELLPKEKHDAKLNQILCRPITT